MSYSILFSYILFSCLKLYSNMFVLPLLGQNKINSDSDSASLEKKINLTHSTHLYLVLTVKYQLDAG